MAATMRNAVASCPYKQPRLARAVTTYPGGHPNHPPQSGGPTTYPGGPVDANTLGRTERMPVNQRDSASERKRYGSFDTFVKPASPFHYSGEPGVQDAIQRLRQVERDVRWRLHQLNVSDDLHGGTTGALSRLGVDPARIRIPSCRWRSAYDLTIQLSCPVNDEQRLRIIESLERLRALLGQAAISDRVRPPLAEDVHPRPRLVDILVDTLGPFISGRATTDAENKSAVGDKPLAKLDAYGRASATGRRKSARATVWMIATKHMQASSDEAKGGRGEAEQLVEDTLAARADGQKAEEASTRVPKPLSMYGLSAEPTIGRVLVNNKPMVQVMDDPHQRNVVLHPFVMTQTLGDYNVFAVVTEGGPSSQADAVAQAIAKCLFELEGPKVKEILVNSGLLVTDPRVRLRSLPYRRGHRARFHVSGRPGREKRNQRKGGR